MAKFTLNLNGPLLEIPSSIKTASFDYVGRYQIIGELITRYQKSIGSKPKNILDVGGRGSFLDQVLPNKITILDNEVTEDNEGETNGDGAHMTSIGNGQYDIVISSDTLEHIPKKDRNNFVSELIRASSDLIILCAPFGDDGAALEEDKLQKFYINTTGHPHRWLKEYKDYGLPSCAETEKIFNEKGLKPLVITQSTFSIWRQLLEINLLANEIDSDDVRSTLKKVNEYYNINLMFKDFPQKGYRKFIIASKKNDISLAPIDQSIDAEDYAALSRLITELYGTVLENGTLLPTVKDLLASKDLVIEELIKDVGEARAELERVTNSNSWKYTRPLRGLRALPGTTGFKSKKKTKYEK